MAFPEWGNVHYFVAGLKYQVCDYLSKTPVRKRSGTLRKLAIGIIVGLVFSTANVEAAEKHHTINNFRNRVETLSSKISSNHKLSFIPEIDELSKKDRTETFCLSIAVYHEVRTGFMTKNIRSVEWVIHVILNRAQKRNVSICEIIWEKGQFPWVYLSSGSLVPKEPDEWVKSQNISYNHYIKRSSRHDITGGALFFYDHNVVKHVPVWARKGKRIQVGEHTFVIPKSDDLY